jgi:ubiquinone/menaquinone biosynthesis C-methylase UbiE
MHRVTIPHSDHCPEHHHTWAQAVEWLRSDPAQATLVRDCYLDVSALDAANRFAASEEWTAIVDLLGARLQGSVVDLGAGRGIASYAFAKAGMQVTAVEPEDGNISGVGAIRELASAAQLPITVVQASGEELPLPDASFDVVYARASLHHVRDLEQVCREVFRILKPGGVFLATREHVIAKPGHLATFLRRHPLASVYGGENAFPLRHYTESICAAGFTIKKIYGPFANAINRFPRTNDAYTDLLARPFRPFLGSRIAHAIVRQPLVQLIASFILERVYYQPGQLYSFVAQKHS